MRQERSDETPRLGRIVGEAEQQVDGPRRDWILVLPHISAQNFALNFS
jgi:hypothetical protein